MIETRELKKIVSISNLVEFEKLCNKGYTIVVSPPDVLQIDIDADTDAYDIINEHRVCLAFALTLLERATTTSKSGGRHHYLRFNRQFTIKEKIRLQVEFGSDPYREYLLFIRQSAGISDPCVLIEVDITKVPQWAIDKNPYMIGDCNG